MTHEEKMERIKRYHRSNRVKLAQAGVEDKVLDEQLAEAEQKFADNEDVLSDDGVETQKVEGDVGSPAPAVEESEEVPVVEVPEDESAPNTST